MINFPIAPPAIAPGRNDKLEMATFCRLRIKPPDELPFCSSVTDRPKCAARSDFNSQIEMNPPRMPKLHQGRGSFPCSPCWPGLRPAKIDVARAGVIVMALTAEMSMEAEIVNANC